MFAFKMLLVGIQVVAAIGMVIVILMQTTKSEGLTGTIGGKASTTFRGKPGSDEKLGNYTRWTAITFMVASVLVAYVHPL